MACTEFSSCCAAIIFCMAFAASSLSRPNTDNAAWPAWKALMPSPSAPKASVMFRVSFAWALISSVTSPMASFSSPARCASFWYSALAGLTPLASMLVIAFCTSRSSLFTLELLFFTLFTMS